MKKPERSTYSSLEFLEWYEGGALVISPKFQRRSVWTRPAQSYLIDTLLLGLPVPPLYLRVSQHPKKNMMIREVVDGQQRITAVLAYMRDKYSLSKNIESPCINKKYSELEPSEQNAIAHYSFICEVLHGADDEDVLRIFARLNTHAVKLNAQELRNGHYFGKFKQSAYKLAVEHLEFWRQKRLFTEQGIARMLEVELTSELLIAMIAGLQDKKKTVDAYYQEYDDAFTDRIKFEDRFRSTIDAINEVAGDNLDGTEFRRVPLFYSLFCAVYHRLHQLPKFSLATTAKGRLSRADQEGLAGAIQSLSNAVEQTREGERMTRSLADFLIACLRQTDNLKPRLIRLETIYKAAFL